MHNACQKRTYLRVRSRPPVYLRFYPYVHPNMHLPFHSPLRSNTHSPLDSPIPRNTQLPFHPLIRPNKHWPFHPPIHHNKHFLFHPPICPDKHLPFHPLTLPSLYPSVPTNTYPSIHPSVLKSTHRHCVQRPLAGQRNSLLLWNPEVHSIHHEAKHRRLSFTSAKYASLSKQHAMQAHREFCFWGELRHRWWSGPPDPLT
jgi:hypothetical protein